MKNCVMFVFVFVLSISFISMAQDSTNNSESILYVATDGNNSWSGTLPKPNEDKTDGPLASIQGALEKIKNIRTSNDGEKTIHVFLRNGVYSINEPIVIPPECSGKKDAPTIFENYQGEKPIISGGKKVSGWQKEEKWYVADIDDVRAGKLSFDSL